MFGSAVRSVRLTSVLLAAVFVLAGCLKVNVGIEVNEEGTVNLDFVLAVERSLLEMDPALSGLPDDELVAAVLSDEDTTCTEDGFDVDGVTTEPYVTDQWVGVRCRAEAVAIDEFNGEAGSITQAGGVTTVVLPLEDFSNDLGSEFDAADAADPMAQRFMESLEIVFSVSAPGGVVEHNGTQVEGSTVYWEIDPFEGSGPTALKATWSSDAERSIEDPAEDKDTVGADDAPLDSDPVSDSGAGLSGSSENWNDGDSPWLFLGVATAVVFSGAALAGVVFVLVRRN